LTHRKERNIKRNAVFGEFLLTCIVYWVVCSRNIQRQIVFLGAKDKVQNSVATQLDIPATSIPLKKIKPVAPTIIISKPDTSNQQQDSLLALAKSYSKSSYR
jgi:hypothetical protein